MSEDKPWGPGSPERRSSDVGAGTVPDLVRTYAGLTDAVNSLTRSNDHRERRNALVYTLLTALIIVAIVVPLYIRHLGTGSREAIFRIVDCTTEGGQCFEESAARQQAAVAELARQNATINLELSSCLVSSKTAAELRRCARANVTALQQ